MQGNLGHSRFSERLKIIDPAVTRALVGIG